MKTLKLILLFIVFQSCATKKYINAHLLSEDIKAAIEEIYLVDGTKKNLIQKKNIVFTKNGRIKASETFDAQNNLIEETEKRLWFEKKTFPDKESHYCKTRWKPKQRERISCYSQKKYKQNEAIYYYNTNGTIAKIVDNFTSFYIQEFFYKNNELVKISISDKNEKPIEEISIKCNKKDKKGTCLRQTRTYKISNQKQEISILPTYKNIE